MIVIVTDSTAYLARQEAKDLKILKIPMTYTLGDDTYLEGFADDYAGGIARIFDGGEKHAKTSQPGMNTIHHRFARLRAANCEVLCLTISSRLSGTYSNAAVCARELGGKGIRVVDTRCAAAGHMILLWEAKRMIDCGMELDAIADELIRLRDKVKMYFSVRDLTPLRRSGRLGFVRQSVGTMLNQRPILTFSDGAVEYHDTARGANEQLRKLARVVPEGADHVTVQSAAGNAAAEKLRAALEEKYATQIPHRLIGPVLGIHLGLDAIGVAWLEK